MRCIHIALVCFSALVLAACNTGGIQSASSGAAVVADAAGVPKPTPCKATTIDEKGLILAATGVSLAAQASSILFTSNVITPGTEKALNIALLLDRARNAVNAASEARDACNATSYSAALSDVNAALAEFKSAIK